MTEPIYVCPECDSDRVTAEHIQTFMVYTGGHFSHSVKTHDSDSLATCLACWWEGERKDLKEATMSKRAITIEVEDDEVLVALKRPDEYDDVHPELVSEDAIKETWPAEYRIVWPKEPTHE